MGNINATVKSASEEEFHEKLRSWLQAVVEEAEAKQAQQPQGVRSTVPAENLGTLREKHVRIW